MSEADAFREARLIVRRDRSRIIEAAMAGRRACAALEEGHMQKTEAQLMWMVQLIREEIAAQDATRAEAPTS
ncbi:hypothetical protein [Methylobacterium brachiatum]|uniref:hypothetical protein n=1 Tax=Methylobacterium brachiatum TaxID=269660 RepID=UPI002448B34C|nr:hypothetical protein [Methylobacterium brachiatum]MDH2311430.1 hypothetical protein [Methylobacterium brachiatum]